MVQSNVLNSAAAAIEGWVNSVAEHINSVHVNNVKIRPVLVILEKAVVREVALFFPYYCILCRVNWQLMIL